VSLGSFGCSLDGEQANNNSAGSDANDEDVRDSSMCTSLTAVRVQVPHENMADVINLNRARKRKRREAEREQAERNRVVHGRTKLDKQLAERERERADNLHAEHERQADPPTPEDAPDDSEV
jgi:hypothetical protein